MQILNIIIIYDSLLMRDLNTYVGGGGGDALKIFISASL